MTNGSLRQPGWDVNSALRAASVLLAAACLMGPYPAAIGQDEALAEVTLQVLDDVSSIEGVLMPLEEEPEPRTDADSTPEPETPAPPKPDEE